MTGFDKKYTDTQFERASKACSAVCAAHKEILELRVMRNAEFWNKWSKANGFSMACKKSHRFFAVFRVKSGKGGELCYSMSNRDEPEIAVLDVLKSCELMSVLAMNRDGGPKPVYKFWQKLRGITDEFANEMEK